MPLKFSPNNAARSRPYIFGLKDQYLIYLVMMAISGLVISGNAALMGLPTLPFVLVFLAVILAGYSYFRKIEKNQVKLPTSTIYFRFTDRAGM
jgi:flagellar biosynthesis component FlhA